MHLNRAISRLYGSRYLLRWRALMWDRGAATFVSLTDA
jgi:hypothetical protein